MRARLSPDRYINNHSASGARHNRLSIMETILPRELLHLGRARQVHGQGFRASAGAVGVGPGCPTASRCATVAKKPDVEPEGK